MATMAWNLRCCSLGSIATGLSLQTGFSLQFQLINQRGRFQVKREVAVLETDRALCGHLRALLTDHRYRVAALNSLTEIERHGQAGDCRAVIVDLDTMTVDNRIIRDFKRKNPKTNIIALSTRQFHPELEEALRNYISACLVKPIDPDELFYWLRSIFENEEEPEA
jgi:DNA-binding NtrC family response regulator